MRILFLGDIVGRAGREAVCRQVPHLIETERLDFVVVNAENAAGGFGITEDIFNTLRDAGVDAVTLGNHAFDQREALIFIGREERLLRPANFPPGTPGRGTQVVHARCGARVMVINIMGRVFMEALDDPFAAIHAALEMTPLGERAEAIIVDFHAEASSEKQAMAHFVDGRATLLVGTHTHVPTADHRVLPGGAAYQTDIGMCGDYDSIIGMEKSEPLRRFTTKLPGSRFSPALGAATVCGLIAETDSTTGLARNVEPLRLGGVLAPTHEM